MSDSHDNTANPESPVSASSESTEETQQPEQHSQAAAPHQATPPVAPQQPAPQQPAPQQPAPQQPGPQQAPFSPGSQFPAQGPAFGAVPPNNHLGWAIASMLLFWPIGIVSIVKMSEVHSFWAMGWLQHAEHSAAEAKKWGKIGVITGACLTGLSFVLVFVYFIVLFAFLQRHSLSGA